MKVRILGVAGGEFSAAHVKRFVGLPLGLFGMKHRALILGDGMLAQAFARAEVVAQLVLAERLPVVFKHRPTDPRPQAVARPVGTHLVVVQPQHDAVRSQGHGTALHPGVSREVPHRAVHPEIDVVGAVIDRVVLTQRQWTYQHTKKNNPDALHRASAGP